MPAQADIEQRYVIDTEAPGDCCARRLKPEHHLTPSTISACLPVWRSMTP
jgi:hypothetical protein